MQHRTRNTRHTNKTLDCFCFNFNYASVQFRLEYDFCGLFLRCRMRGQPAAFAVSWRVIEPSAKSKHFTLPSRKKKSQLKRTPAHCACACLQKQRSDGATEQRSCGATTAAWPAATTAALRVARDARGCIGARVAATPSLPRQCACLKWLLAAREILAESKSLANRWPHLSLAAIGWPFPRRPFCRTAHVRRGSAGFLFFCFFLYLVFSYS